jgi:hypothetical protein
MIQVAAGLFLPELLAAADAQDLAEKDAVIIQLRVLGGYFFGEEIPVVEFLPEYLPALDDQVGLLETGSRGPTCCR